MLYIIPEEYLDTYRNCRKLKPWLGNNDTTLSSAVHKRVLQPADEDEDCMVASGDKDFMVAPGDTG